ncbi:MAG: AAA family ATPase [Gammaproteobacteria bacterium]|jgi:ATP-dependent DNA helicase PIF1|nr:AAA family ATPase [Gammaproteobacteria bacterium]MBT4463003.1 AAA family ATPase [Gammaproteobacteria bacterium]MBT4654574.1 AAA family ATPase [Gammaproteobacteria bacterium]MBT5117112.1 AAA family ATPase [Gammaproteobacteria bacterium]MBT5761260.1 AAA family ATPase [Gammaproteobacteria bacterium]
MQNDFILNDDFNEIISLFENSTKNIFITGKAGTGKSSLINYIKRKTSKNLIVLAPTAIAALNINAKTIHSFFNFPFHVITPDVIKKHYNKRLIKEIDTILVDEVSMLRPDIIDAIDLTLQMTRENKEPFGGIQMIFVGDLYQLPPVITKDEVDVMNTLYPDGYFFFNSNIINKIELVKFELSHVFRQSDKKLISLLDRARKATLDDDDLMIFNKRIVKNDFIVPEEVLTLSTNNYKVNSINASNLKNISSKEYIYHAEIDGKYSGAPVDEELRMKVGAQVMLVKNSKNWVNGTLATIDKLSKKEIHIRVKDEVYLLEPETWERFEYIISDKKISSSVSATFTQYPIKLAWAATIHKCQGQTFENVMIDMDYGAFAHGQTYVALSRVVSLDGLFLKKPLRSEDFIFNPAIKRFLE